jgi:MFS family permease
MGMAALVPTFVANPSAVLWLVVFFLVAAMVVNLAAATFWFPLLHDIIPENFRGRFFGKLRATWSTLLFGAIIGGGLFLGDSPATWQFQSVMFIGVVLVFLRHGLLMRISANTRSDATVDDYRDWKHYLKDLYNNHQVRRFTIYVAIVGCTAGFLGHPLVLFMRDLGFSPRDNIIVFGFTTLGMVLTLYIGGYVVDRLGPFLTLRVVHIVMMLMLFAIAGITTLPPPYLRPLLAGAFALSGAAIAILNLACTTQLFHYAPERGRVFFLSLTNAMLFVGPALAMFIAGTVLKLMGSTRTVTLVGTDVSVFQIMLVLAGAGTLFAFPLLGQLGRVHPK